MNSADEQTADVAETPTAESDAEDAPIEGADSDWGRAHRLVAAGLGLALIASLVAIGVLLSRDETSAPEAGPAAQALELQEAAQDADAAAREAIVAMTSYNYLTVEEDFAWVDEAGTEKFQEFFGAQSEQTIRLIKEIKAEAEGEVIDSAAVATSVDEAKVLMYVDQTITDPDSPEPKISQPRITMFMVLREGTWLVDEVQIQDLLGQ